MIAFDKPLFLFFLLIIPLVIYLQYFIRKRGGAFYFPFRIWGSSKQQNMRGPFRMLVFIVAFLGWTGMAFLVFALAGPQQVRQQKTYLNQGIDILFVLDQSPSMGGTDFPPDNRFETAKQMLSRFVEGRSNDAIGLVGFGTNAVLRVPPTTDYDFLLSRLDELNVMDMGEGTAIGMGIAVAALHLSHGSSREKVIVLLTDGDNNAGEIPPEMAANIAKDLDIKIYSIGIGTPGEVPVEVIDPQSGQLTKAFMRSQFNEVLLQRISVITGGEYFKAVSPGILETIFQTIDSIEKSDTRVSLVVQTEPMHRLYIILGLIFFGLSYIARTFLLREAL